MVSILEIKHFHGSYPVGKETRQNNEDTFIDR